MRVSAWPRGCLGWPARPTGCTWFTVGPTEPCSTICSILASGGSCSVAKASSRVFFCMSSMATSTGVSTVCGEGGRAVGRHWLRPADVLTPASLGQPGPLLGVERASKRLCHE